ncbi:MAG: hypothetical protein JSS50_05145 [Proteobacteria bacterium]|nr:hypothetical protein [Pseudomonadota bacterium]
MLGANKKKSQVFDNLYLITLRKAKISCVAATTLGLIIMGTGIGMGLGNVEAAFVSLGGVNLYQALALGGSIMAFLSTTTWLIYERHPKHTEKERGLFSSPDFLDTIHPNLRYGAGIYMALYGGMAILGGYLPIMRAEVKAKEIALAQMMSSSGFAAGFLTIILPIACGVFIDRMDDKSLDKPFFAYCMAAGLSSTAIATMIPYLMEHTSLFADPAAISVSFFVSLAVVPVLGILAREATRAVQEYTMRGYLPIIS